jgi:spermidine synthase
MSFACIAHTIEDTGVATHPYHCYVPSFGEWGFVLGLKRSRKVPAPLKPGLPRRYLDDATLRGLFVFPADMQIRETEINTLNSQALVSYYNNEWQP